VIEVKEETLEAYRKNICMECPVYFKTPGPGPCKGTKEEIAKCADLETLVREIEGR